MAHKGREQLRQTNGADRRGLAWSLLLAMLVVASGPGCGNDDDRSGGGSDGAVQDVVDVASDAPTSDGAPGDVGNDASEADGSGDAPDGAGFDPLVPPTSGYAAVFLDVGQGDATLLIAASGETALIDGGVSTATLTKRLGRLGVTRIDMVIATHADADHISGLPQVLMDYAVGKILWNGVTKGTQIFDAFLAAAETEPDAEVKIARRGDHFTLGNLDLEVLHPGPSADESDDHNNQSVVIQTGCAGAWLLMPGDAEAPAEEEMEKAGVYSDIDVLHVAHHGSSSGTSAAMLAATKPEVAVISAGAENAYGHPDADVLERLDAAGSKVWRTDIGWDDDSVWMHADCKGGLTFGRVP